MADTLKGFFSRALVRRLAADITRSRQHIARGSQVKLIEHGR
jgi:hypothetical protein